MPTDLRRVVCIKGASARQVDGSCLIGQRSPVFAVFDRRSHSRRYLLIRKAPISSLLLYQRSFNRVLTYIPKALSNSLAGMPNATRTESSPPTEVSRAYLRVSLDLDHELATGVPLILRRGPGSGPDPRTSLLNTSLWCLSTASHDSRQGYSRSSGGSQWRGRNRTARARYQGPRPLPAVMLANYIAGYPYLSASIASICVARRTGM
jgi:hypothetical protein